jgi:H+/gluconate symporter-like permease
LRHRVAVIDSDALDSLPHNGAVVTLPSVCGSTQGASYKDSFMVGILGAIIALVVVILLGSLVGSF